MSDGLAVVVVVCTDIDIDMMEVAVMTGVGSC